MLPLSLVPSLPAPSRDALEALFLALSGVAREFQVDIVDGVFVPHTSWPFTEADPLLALASLAPWSTTFSLEIDCMVHEPLQYLDTIAMLGAHRVVVHLGSTDDYEAIIEHARAHGYSIGFAATADIPQGDLEHFIPQIDFVQLMGIVRVGQQGQPFDTRTLTRARALREQYPDLDIAVDGAVNAHTIPQLYAAGVNRFAPGSAIATATDPAAAYCALAAQIGL